MKKRMFKKELTEISLRLLIIFLALTLFFITLFYFIPSKPLCLTDHYCLESENNLFLYATTLSTSILALIITIKVALYTSLFLLARGLIIHIGLGLFFTLGILTLLSYKYILDPSDPNPPTHILYIAWSLILTPIFTLGFIYFKKK